MALMGSEGYIIFDDLFPILQEAQDVSGLTKYMELITRDDIKILKNEVELFGRKVLISFHTDKKRVIIDTEWSMESIVAYYNDSSEGIKEFTDTLGKFSGMVVSKFKEELSEYKVIDYVAGEGVDKESGDFSAIDEILLKDEIYQEIKKHYPEAKYNIGGSTIYIPEYESVSLRVPIGKAYSIHLKKNWDEIDIGGSYYRMNYLLEEGSLIEHIKPHLLQTIYRSSTYHCGAKNDIIDKISYQFYSWEEIENIREHHQDYRKGIITRLNIELTKLGYNPDSVYEEALEIEFRSNLTYFKYKDTFFYYNSEDDYFVSGENERELLSKI